MGINELIKTEFIVLKTELMTSSNEQNNVNLQVPAENEGNVDNINLENLEKR